MMDIEKYLPEELKKKKKPMITVTVRPMNNDEVYDQALIEGGVGFEPSMKHMMDTAMGKDTTQLQMYHGVSSSGMQVL